MGEGKLERFLHKNGKKAVIMLSWFLISTTILSNITPHLTTQAAIFIDPPVPNVSVGDYFTVNLSIADVTDLWSWEVWISFDPSRMNCSGAEEGPFLKSAGPTVWLPPEINNTAGTIHMGCSLMPGFLGASGSGVLAYVDFECIGVGSSFIHIEDSMLLDSFGGPIPHDRVDGEVKQIQPRTGYGPRADELQIHFYPSQGEVFAAMNASEIDLMNDDVTESQLEMISSMPGIQIPGLAGGFYMEPRHTWAVLISGGGDKSSNEARFWNDIGQCYYMLLSKGYTDEEIYVLYADGNGPGSTNCDDCRNTYGYCIWIDYAATKANLSRVCSDIASKAGEHDTLFVFTTNHGSTLGTAGVVDLTLWGESIRDSDFAGSNYFGQITQLNKRIFLLEHCYSGGFIDNLKDSKTVIATAAQRSISHGCDNEDKDGNYVREGYYDEFSLYFISALDGQTPYGRPRVEDADSNGDGWISLREAYDWAKDCNSVNDYPAWSDQGNHGSYWRLPEGHWTLVPKSSNMHGVHYMPYSPQKLGPDNYWTFLRANSTEGPIRYGLASIPEAINVITSSHRSDWDCLDRIYDTLLTFSPYDQSIRTGLRPRMAWNWKLGNWAKQVTNETLGFGNGTLTEFHTKTAPLIEYSETIYLGETSMTRDVDYTIHYGTGLVNFTIPPPPEIEVKATYEAPCTKVTFYLRNNIMWHDGMPCTAEDIEFTIGCIQSFGEMAHNYLRVKNVHHTEMPDPYTIVVYEDILNPWALWWIGSLPIIPRHIFEDISDPTGYTPGNLPPELVLIGCGPWRCVDLVPSGHMILTANRDYYLKTPPRGEIDFYMQIEYEPSNPQDGYKIAIYDIVRICAAYGSQGYEIPDKNFDPGCDINPAGHTCTVNLYDIVVACGQYGTVWGTSGIWTP